ncbi:uncharacterized protein AC631_00682 [Debaryomyces fabryi]|uniref:Uncharacterized protein n=1 Tax=Debaryomyces fabryi TaxID=58627 RepID=A0A0V1Q4Y0_9ASCO|nr:uncharacterized protein AC631_00682 [Debaryomyces fabryi]KSA03543.1 hypothetical protein AC631_00682 [Debaryomyces fabryi]
MNRVGLTKKANLLSNSLLEIPQYNLQNNVSEDDLYKYANVDSELEVPEPIYSSVSRESYGQLDAPLKQHETRSSFSYSENSMTDDEKKYKRSSLVFLAISIVSAILILAFESYMYAIINIHKQQIDRPAKYIEISIYLSFFIFAAIYQVGLTAIGLRSKNMLLLTMLCGFYGCMLIYTGIQYAEISETVGQVLERGRKRATQAMNIATITVIGVTLVLQAYMIFVVLRKNVKWFRYKKIGADLKIKKMYTIFQIHRSLLIFNFFFFLGFTVQFIVIMIKEKSSVEFILTVCVLPLTLILLFLSDFAATRESIILTAASIIAYIGGCVYVLFKTIRLFTKYSSAYRIAIRPGDYFPGRSSLVTFGVITLVLLFATIVIEIVLLKNYGRGLLPIVNSTYRWLPGHNRNIHNDSYDVHVNDINLDTTEKKTEYNGKLFQDLASNDDGSLLID